MSYIRLQTEIPGPRARDMIARRQAAVPAGMGRATDVVVERASGALIVDVDGNTLIDFAGGIGMMAVGHAPVPVVNAIAAQAQKFVHVCALVATYEPYVQLAELLNEITPGAFKKKTILANSGAEGVENAVKLSRKLHRASGDRLLRGRLSRPHAADVEPDQQVRPVQERLRPVRARDRPAADCRSCSGRRPG